MFKYHKFRCFFNMKIIRDLCGLKNSRQNFCHLAVSNITPNWNIHILMHKICLVYLVNFLTCIDQSNRAISDIELFYIGYIEHWVCSNPYSNQNSNLCFTETVKHNPCTFHQISDDFRQIKAPFLNQKFFISNISVSKKWPIMMILKGLSTIWKKYSIQ